MKTNIQNKHKNLPFYFWNSDYMLTGGLFIKIVIAIIYSLSTVRAKWPCKKELPKW